ncbi:MAG: glycoside hydrolase family 66 protein [Acidimicrobiia bacterium]
MQLRASGARPGALGVTVRILSGADEVGRFDHTLDVSADGSGNAVATFPLPAGPDGVVNGYAVEVATDDGSARATTAFDIAAHWSMAPRYGFFSDFDPPETDEESQRRADDLLKLHVNVVQFYDWMASHHTFAAPQPEFVDPLGRSLSHRVVRRKIALAHARGMAALAYGALYGAEEAFSSAHPDWLLYDGAGHPLVLADLFYLQDFSRASGWRAWILDQYAIAVDEFGFDGIHIDQYGTPKAARSRASGTWREVDVAAEFPGFVDEAAAMLEEHRPDGGSIFNCVNAWPLRAMAQASNDAATYIEVWDPHSSYRDLYDLIRRARDLRPTKQPILAAYLRPFHPGDGRLPGAMHTFRLASAAINASGGFHLIAGEGNGLLTEAYYPNYGVLTPDDFAVVRRYCDFAVRHTAALHSGPAADIAWTHVGPANDAIVLAHPDLSRYGAGARPDSLWVVGRLDGPETSLHLINLRGLATDEWNADHPAAPAPLDDIEVRVRIAGDVTGVWWDTPDDEVGIPRSLPYETVNEDDGRFLVFRLPRVAFWSAVWWRLRIDPDEAA